MCSAQINTTLQTLELNSNVIDYDGITALAEALAENSSLTTLHIRCITCCLPWWRRVCGKAELLSCASQHGEARRVSIPFARVRSDNYIGALGAAVLANALKGNAALTGLHIKGNELGNEGVKALCEAFRAREGRVTALDFGNNRRASQICFATLLSGPCNNQMSVQYAGGVSMAVWS